MKLISYNSKDILSALCKIENKYGVYLSTDYSDYDAVFKFLNELDSIDEYLRFNILTMNHRFFLFDNEEDVLKMMDAVKKFNSSDNDIYCISIDKDGTYMDEIS